MTRTTHAARIVSIAGLLLLAFALVPGAFAAKGGGTTAGKKGGGGTRTTYTGTLSGPVMVADTDSDGLLSQGDAITFNVTSNAQYYFVRADCYQNGTLVWEDTEGFYSGWLWGTTYYLSGSVWKSGGANCTAVLFSQNADGSNQQTLAPALSFNVAP